jgi:hypothetical protein
VVQKSRILHQNLGPQFQRLTRAEIGCKSARMSLRDTSRHFAALRNLVAIGA